MGKISILTQEQKSILDEIKNNKYLSQNFYFTGGTALSIYYLKHRYSEDLDFFSKDLFDNRIILNIVEEWSKKYHFKIQSSFIEIVYRFNLTFPQGYVLNLDFAHYPYKTISPPMQKNGLFINSLRDIATNKLLTINQRTDVKDFVDLYFLLKKFTIWDLIEGVRVKFRMGTEPLILAVDLLKVEDFNHLPKMIKKLNLETLKVFFRKKAELLSKKSVR